MDPETSLFPDRDVWDILAEQLDGSQLAAQRFLRQLWDAGYSVCCIDPESRVAAMEALAELLPDHIHATTLAADGPLALEADVNSLMQGLAQRGYYLVAKPQVRHDLVSLDGGMGLVLATHPQDRCMGRHCCIHNPSTHPLSSTPLRYDEQSTTMFRICSHDIVHPDPDHLAFVREVHGEDAAKAQALHPCDSCCTKEPIP